MKGSRRDGHLLGSRVLQSPQSPPSCPVNTQLQQLSPGDVLTHLGCSEDTWLSPGLAAVALTEDIPAAHLGPPCLAPLLGPAKQKYKNNPAAARAVGDALLPQPISSCIFMHQVSLPVPCSF